MSEIDTLRHNPFAFKDDVIEETMTISTPIFLDALKSENINTNPAYMALQISLQLASKHADKFWTLRRSAPNQPGER